MKPADPPVPPPVQRFWWTVVCTCGWRYPVDPYLANRKDADMKARAHRDKCPQRVTS